MNIIIKKNITKKSISSKKIRCAFQKTHKKTNLNLKNPKILFHFTNCDALEKILISKELWLSHYQSLNDNSEVQFLYDQISRSLPNNTIHKELFDNFKNDYWCKLNIFSVSMCEEFKNDHLWEKYSKKGTGVALGYETIFLKDSIEKTNYKFIETMIKYGKNEISRCFGPLLTRFFEYIKKEEAYQNKIIPEFLSILLSEMPCFKEKTWEEEKEYRYFIMDHSPDKKISENLITESNHIPLKNIYPSKIILGKNCNLTKNDIEALLEKNNLKKIEITSILDW